MGLVLLDEPGLIITEAEAVTVLMGISLGSQTEAVEAVIRDADAWLAGVCGWGSPEAGYTFELSSWEEMISGPMPGDSRRIRLALRPVVSIDEIADDPDWDWDSNIVASSAYVDHFLGRGQVAAAPSSGHSWSTAPDAIRVRYQAGWTSDDLPSKIRRATLLLVRHLWDLRRTQGARNASIEGRSQTRTSEGLPIPVRQLIGRYVLAERGLF